MKKISFVKEKQSFKTVESFKALRTNLMFCGNDVKTIAVTSCLPNDGKSYISKNLAVNLCDIGKKVILVDADLRKSILVGKLSTHSKIKGLSHYLSGQCELSEVICTNEDNENMDVIFTGSFPPNPAELLGSETFKNLIKELREKYDYVIVDTPPLGSVIDSAIVSPVCDGTILVIRNGQVSYKFARSIVEQLEKSKCRILGTVLNGYDTSTNSRYRKYYNNYYYYYHTKDEDGNDIKKKKVKKSKRK